MFCPLTNKECARPTSQTNPCESFLKQYGYPACKNIALIVASDMHQETFTEDQAKYCIELNAPLIYVEERILWAEVKRQFAKLARMNPKNF